MPSVEAEGNSNTQSSFRTLVTDHIPGPLPLKHFFNNPDFSDVVLTVGSEDTQTQDFFASRVILAAW